MFVWDELQELRRRVGAYAARFDAALVSAEQAVAIVEGAAAIEKMAATIKALAAARLAKTRVWERDGDLSAAHALARTTGTTVTKAREALRTAERLAEQPALAAAARRGAVSPEQAAAISDAAAADPSAEARLVATARTASLQQLRDECERTVAAADRDAEERHRRIHAARCARRRSCPDGSAEVLYRSTRDEIAEVWSVVSGFADRAFHEARRAGGREPAEAYAADGLLAMARAAAAPPTASGAPVPGGRKRPRSPVPTRVVVRVDWDALVRGWPAAGETCEIAGVGAVPVSVVHAMMASGDPFLAAVVTRGADVVNVAHLGRRPDARQRTALDWLQPTCSAQGCDTVAHLEHDHRRDWTDTRITLLGWLDRLCGRHHDRKTYEGWALVDGAGKRPMVPPDDPRHPRHAPPRPDASTNERANAPPRESDAA